MKNLFILAAVLLASALQNSSSAAIITSNGDVALQNVFNPADPAPLDDIKSLLGTGGVLFTNQTSGVAFTNGTVATIAIVPIGGAQDGQTFSSVAFPDQSSAYVIAALQGTIQIVSGTPVALFTSGRAALISQSGGLQANQPDTWNYTNRIAEYALKPQEEVISGVDLNGGANVAADINLAASQTNISALNIALPLGSNAILFREDSTAQQSAMLVPGSATLFGGDNFVFNVDDFSSLLGPGLQKTDEAFVAIPQQTPQFNITAISSGLDGADLAVLNALALWGFGGSFATGIGGAVDTDWNPTGDGVNATGDFRAGLDGSFHIGHQFIPEPSSLLVFAGLFGVAGVVQVSRRRRV
ncbi:MAG: hypothetical protein DCC68_11095 [Planctomycetota bacterium]|nr:MAG: hypothetical protein DCC68_11095 [Planctomycetota bacterium]